MRKNLLVLFLLLVIAVIPSFGQGQDIPQHRYFFTISSAQTAGQQKDNVEIIRQLFNTNYCKYVNNKSAFVLALSQYQNVEAIKNKLLNGGILVTGNVTYKSKTIKNTNSSMNNN